MGRLSRQLRNNFMQAALSLLLAGLFSWIWPNTINAEEPIRLNHLQMIGTHNSYKLLPDDPILGLVKWVDLKLGQSIEYAHLPLKEQLARLGIRQIELDLYADPEGGHYAKPLGPQLAGLRPKEPAPELLKPGIKVMHVQDFDFRSHCLTLKACLREIKEWSDENSDHTPLMVLLEAKDEKLRDPLHLGLTVPLAISQQFMDSIDQEILAVFSSDHLITPDLVRAEFESLEQAILTRGWPRLSEVRGKIMFALDNSGKARDLYLAGHQGLKGRIMFTNSARGTPEAGFIKLNVPLGSNRTRIEALVKAGYLVRTRADAHTWQARTNNHQRKEAAMASGAHFISTDFPIPSAALGLPYHVSFPDGKKIRCNPLIAPPSCAL